MKKYFSILPVIIFMLLVSMTVRSQVVSQKPATAKDLDVRVAPIKEIPQPTTVDKNVKPSTLPKMVMAEVKTISEQSLDKTETKPIEQILPARPVEGLRISPVPVNMDRPKQSTVVLAKEKELKR